MKNFRRSLIFAVIIVCAVATVAVAQNASTVSGSVWFDTFAGKNGVVLYPQYAWGVKTRTGDFDGYGFIESAPREPLFTNNLVVFTPAKFRMFSVQTETGGLPRGVKGAPEAKGFFQVGPRLNVHEAVPKLKGTMHYLFVTALPSFRGIRPNNLLIAGATNRVSIANDVELSVEGYRRIFGGRRPDYSEYWFL